MGILQDKNILITGVLTDASLAFGVAQLAINEGANVVVTGAGRGLRLTERTVRKLEGDVEVLEFDVTNPTHVSVVHDRLKGKVDTSRWCSTRNRIHAGDRPRGRLLCCELG